VTIFAPLLTNRKVKSRQQRKQYFEPHANGHTGSSVLLYGAEGRDGHGALKRLRQRF